MLPLTMVVLSRYEQVFQPFVDSVSHLHGTFDKVLVRDGNHVNCPNGWTVIQGPEEFHMAHNANLGWNMAYPNDILYCGDDIRFLHSQTVSRLREVAYSRPDIAMVSPRLIGRTSSEMANAHGYMTEISPMGFWFPCVYIRHSTIEKVGYLDERFHSFCDDLDYSLRCRKAGLTLISTNYVSVRHLGTPENGPTTFAMRKINLGEKLDQSYDLFSKKWGMTPLDLERFSKTGDLSLAVNACG